jgi:hypothetical protein
MGTVKRDFFGPAESVELRYVSANQGGLTQVYPLEHESVLALRLSGFSESDIHFLIRFIESVGLLSGFPKVPVEKMEEFVDALRALFALINGLKDGFDVQDVSNVINILDRIYNLLH